MKERELPEGWEIGKISDFSKSNDEPVQTGPFGAQLHASDYVDEGVPLILIKNVFGGKIIEKDLPRITHDKANALSRYQLKKGDIVFSRVGSVGRVAVVQEHQAGWLISGQMLRVRLENPEIDSKFLNYMIQTNWFSKALEKDTVGTTRKSINTEILRNLPLIKPPLPVQRQIVAVLQQAEAVKRQRQEADALTGALLQSVFREMFGDPVSNERGWVKRKIGDITINLDEKRIPIKKSEREIATRLYPYYGASGIIDYVDDFIFDGNFLLVGEDGANLLARTTPIAFRATGKIWVNNHAHVLQADEETCDVFLEFFINSIDLKKYVTGTAQPKLTQRALNDIPVSLPPLALQQQFARVVQEVEKIREQQAKSKKEIDVLFDGLMAGAFTGQLA